MPKAATLSRAVETATKCLATAAERASSVSSMAPEETSESSSQVRTQRALVRVSRVPKVLEATITRVVSGSRSAVLTAASVGSMLEMNRHSRPGLTYGLRAS